MLPKVVFDKQRLSNLKILSLNKKQIQNDQKSIGKTIPACGFQKFQEKTANKKSRDFCQICDFQKIHRLGYGFKNIPKIYRLACYSL
jgi:hypothetical protein